MITICLTHFKSLGLANLEAALYSVRRQNLSRVTSLVIVDNDSGTVGIRGVIDELGFPMPVRLLSFRHNDPTKTHSWSTNVAVSEADTPWVLFTRSDYILDFDALEKFTAAARGQSDVFVTGNVCHLASDVGVCEKTGWRERGPAVLFELPCAVADYTVIDAGVWLARKDAFVRVGGLDEGLTAWGHAQTHFQHKLYVSGTKFVRIPEVLFYHPQHAAVRDIDLAHSQLADLGVSLKELWARHEGVQPY